MIWLIICTIANLVKGNDSPLPKLVITQQETLLLNLNDYFLVNNPEFNYTQPEGSSLIVTLNQQLNKISEFSIGFDFKKKVPVPKTPFVIFLEENGNLRLGYRKDEVSIEIRQTIDLKNIYLENNKFPSYLDCKDMMLLLASGTLVIDCNFLTADLPDFSLLNSVFYYVNITNSSSCTMFVSGSNIYNIFILKDYMLNAERMIYLYDSYIFLYSPCSLIADCKDRGTEILVFIIDYLNTKICFHFYLNEGSLSIPQKFQPLRVQRLLVHPLRTTLLILDYNYGVYQYSFKDFHFKSETMIKFEDDNKLNYNEMTLESSEETILLETYDNYLIVSSTNYIVEILLRNNDSFFFAKRYDFSSNNQLLSELLVTSQYIIGIQKDLDPFELDTPYSSNAIPQTLPHEFQLVKGQMQARIMIFSRKKDRLGTHYDGKISVWPGSFFLTFDFYRDKGSFLYLFNGKSPVQVYSIMDCILNLTKSDGVKDREQTTLNVTYISDGHYSFPLYITIIPFKYFNIFSPEKSLQFTFDDPEIYIPLSLVALGPEIEYQYLSDNKAKIFLTIDYIKRIAVKANFSSVLKPGENLINFSIIESQMNFYEAQFCVFLQNNAYSPDLPSESQTRLLKVLCQNVSYNFIEDCSLVSDVYESLSSSMSEYPIDYVKVIKINGTEYTILHHTNNHSNFIYVINEATPNITKIPLSNGNYSKIEIIQDYILIALKQDRNSEGVQNELEVWYFYKNNYDVSLKKSIDSINNGTLNLSYALNITQLDTTLVREGILMLLNSYTNILVIKIFVDYISTFATPIFAFKLCQDFDFDSHRVVDVKFFVMTKDVKKIVILTSEQMKEYSIDSPYSFSLLRIYPLYSYNQENLSNAFSDGKLVYIYANYFDDFFKTTNHYLLVYNPDKSSAGVLIQHFEVDDPNNMTVFPVEILGAELSYTLQMDTTNGNLFVTAINLNPALQGRFYTAYNSTFSSEVISVNISFKNIHSNRELVLTLSLTMVLTDYYLNPSPTLPQQITFDEKTTSINFNTSFFIGPVQDYSIFYENNISLSKDFTLRLSRFLEENSVFSDYQTTINYYGKVLDVEKFNDTFIIVFSDRLALIFLISDVLIPLWEGPTELVSSASNCDIIHHRVEMAFVVFCEGEMKNKAEVYYYSFEDSCLNEENRCSVKSRYKINVVKYWMNVPGFVGFMSNTAKEGDFIFLQTHLMNSDYETEFCIGLFPLKIQSNGTDFKILSILEPAVFGLLNFSSLDFDVFFLGEISARVYFGILAVQSDSLFFTQFYIFNQVVSVIYFQKYGYKLPDSLNSIIVENITSTWSSNFYIFNATCLIGTEGHLYEVDIELDKYNKLNTSRQDYIFRKYSRCVALSKEPQYNTKFLARICDYTMEDKSHKVIFPDIPVPDYFSFIQLYKRRSENSSHPFQIIRTLFIENVANKFLFYSYNGTDHFLVSNYINFLVDYCLYDTLSLNVYRSSHYQAQGQHKPVEINLTLSAENDFLTSPVTLHILLQGDSDHDSKILFIFAIIGVVLVLLILLLFGVYVFRRSHRNRSAENQEPLLYIDPKNSALSNQEYAPSKQRKKTSIKKKLARGTLNI